jgi:hypothetical protein
MNRAFHPLKGAIEPGVVTAGARLDITASSGAVATTSVCALGDSSVGTQGWQYTTTGNWKLTFKEPVAKRAIVTVTMEKATAEAVTAEIISNTLTSSTPAITFRVVAADLTTLTNPSNACSIHVRMHLVDSGGSP